MGLPTALPQVLAMAALKVAISVLPVPLVEQTAHLLREGLGQGRWRGQLPGVVRLAEALGVSTHTLRAALLLLETEGRVALSEDGRSRHVTAKGTADKHQLRIGILLYGPLDEDSPHTIHFMISLHHALEGEGFLPFFSTSNQASLRRDVGRIRDYVKNTPADAWIVSCGTRDVLEWFAAQSFPSFALFGRRDQVALPNAGPDKAPAVIDAIRELIRLGHQRIIMLSNKLRRLPEPGRVERVFLSELARHGLPVSSFNLPDWEETPAGLRALLESLFKITPPTAIIIDELPQLIGVQQFLALRRLRVPEQVSLITTDYDTSFALCQPAVTHVNWHTTPIIRRVVQWAKNVSTGRPDFKPTNFPAELVPGGTIAPVWKGDL